MLLKQTKYILGIFLAASLQVNSSHAEEDRMTILVGPSLYKTIQNVSSQFESFADAEITSDETPRIIKSFCASASEEQKLLIISRKLSLNEMRKCEKEEAKMIGLNLNKYLIAPASNSPSLTPDLDPKTIYLAIAENVPRSAISDSNLSSRKRGDLLASTSDDFIHNPFMKWRDIDASLPDVEINLLIPDGGTAKTIFDAKILEAGCRGFKEVKLIFSAVTRIRTCTQYRTDDHVSFTEGALFQDSRMDLLLSKKPTVGFVRYPELLGGGVLPLRLNGATPNDLKFNSKTFPAAESISIYFFAETIAKNNSEQNTSLTASILKELVSEEMIGPEGAFSKAGFYPLTQTERSDLRSVLRNLRDVGKIGVN